MGEKQGHKLSAPRRTGLGTTSGDTVGRYKDTPTEWTEHPCPSTGPAKKATKPKSK